MSPGGASEPFGKSGRRAVHAYLPKRPVCAPRFARGGKGRRPRARLHVEQLEGRQLLSTYYLSPSGSDLNPGTSSAAPWQTIARANHATIHAGDEILFQGGATFNGNLVLTNQDAGTPASPITISSYGSGPATINAGTGTGISLVDTQGITITDLVIVGSGYSTNAGDGIYLTNDQPGTTLSGITINQVDVSGFGDIGIHLLTSDLGNSTGTQGGNYSGVSITNCTTHDNGYGGLSIEAHGIHVSDLYIGNVQGYHNAGAQVGQPNSGHSGFGIFLWGVIDAVVERSVAYDNGWAPGNQGEMAGIEALECNRVLLQYNESYDNHQGLTDGNGIGIDDSTNSIMQFNYTHDNDGAGLALSAEIGRSSSNLVMRYNISQNDARTGEGGIRVWDDVSNADIYNNTVFMGPPVNSGSAAIRVNGFIGTSVHVRNNIFITTGGVPLVFYDGGGTDLLFQGNDYWSSGAPVAIQWVSTSLGGLTEWRGHRPGDGQRHDGWLSGRSAGEQPRRWRDRG